MCIRMPLSERFRSDSPRSQHDWLYAPPVNFNKKDRHREWRFLFSSKSQITANATTVTRYSILPVRLFLTDQPLEIKAPPDDSHAPQQPKRGGQNTVIIPVQRNQEDITKKKIVIILNCIAVKHHSLSLKIWYYTIHFICLQSHYTAPL